MSTLQSNLPGMTGTLRPTGATAGAFSCTQEVAEELVELYRAGRFIEAIDRLYAEDVVSGEADPPFGEETATGKAVVRDRHSAWLAERELHAVAIRGPYLDGSNRFAMYLRMDLTNKISGKRATVDEIAIYEVSAGQVVQENFLYGPDWA